MLMCYDYDEFVLNYTLSGMIAMYYHIILCNRKASDTSSVANNQLPLLNKINLSKYYKCN